MATILVCGSRTVTNQGFMHKVLDAQHGRISTLVQGAQRGADLIAYNWAINHFIPTCSHPANWPLHDKRAGYLRNAEMLEHHSGISAVLAFVDKPIIESRGTKMMCDLATAKNIRVFIFDTTNEMRLM